MKEMIQKFLELDNWLNDNYENISQEEYERGVKELQEICKTIIGE